jgi:hypothetical protein
MRDTHNDSLSADGLIILTASIGHPGVRERFWQHMEEIPGERVNSSIYEFSIADWDAGLWDEEVQWMNDLLEECSGMILIWKFEKGTYIRFSIGSGD